MCVLRKISGAWLTCLLLCSSWTTPSSAWQLFDHRVITWRALQLYERCHDLRFTATEIKGIVAGNLSEDYNLAVKWLKNSHYYNPDKWVRSLYRNNAAHRVKYLVEKLQAGRQPRLRLLGKIIHFVQDVASPLHVIPITHNINDGFEKFKLPPLATAELNLSCPATAVLSPTVLLKREARHTLASLRTTAFATRNGQPYEFSWSLFWAEGLGSRFGRYGFFGNSFGKTQPLVVMNHVYRFSLAVFHRYKLQQAQQAIIATAATLHWYHSRMLPAVKN